MSLKEDVDYIKKEISVEESYMEKVFKFEKIFKKYKKLIIATIILAFIATVGYYVSSYFAQQNKIHANVAYSKLLKNPNDIEALAVLKAKNKKLYDIFHYKLDTNKQSNVKFFKQLVEYTNAIKENNITKIDSVTQDQDFLLKDFAFLNKAIIQVQNAQYTQAKETLKLIDENSEVSPLAKMLEHFMLTK